METLFEQEALSSRSSGEPLNRCEGGGKIVGNNYPLPTSQTIGFDYPRLTACAGEGEGLCRMLEDAGCSCWHADSGHHLFGKGLATLEACCRSGGAKGGDPSGCETIHDPLSQGRFGANNQQIDPLALCEIEQRIDICERKWYVLTVNASTGIPGNGEKAAETG